MTRREKVAAWCFTLAGPIGYTVLALIVAVNAVRAQDARQVADLEHRLAQVEAVHIDREVAVLAQGQKQLDEKMATLLNIGLLVIGGVIMNLGLSVFRLTIQIKTVAPRQD